MRSSMPWAACAAVVLWGCSSTTDPGVTGTDRTATFEARHEFSVDVPEGAERLQAWFAMPSRRDPHQRVSDWRVTAPYPTRVVRDTRGDEFLYMEAEQPAPGRIEVVTTFTIERQEVRANLNPGKTRPHTPAELASMAADLAPSSQSVITPGIRDLATQAVGGERNPILASRRLYDAVLERVDYHVKDPKPDARKTMNSSGTGSSSYTFEKCTGNCTDFHSLYAAMSRAVGIPTRAVYGSFFKGPLNGVDTDQSYHCWIEFHAPGIGWIPLDVAVADVFTEDFQANEYSRPRADLTVADGYHGPDRRLVDYYFGNIEERRVVWHRGRDLEMTDPRQAGPPLLWNPKAYVEIDGKPGAAGRKLTYREAE